MPDAWSVWGGRSSPVASACATRHRLEVLARALLKLCCDRTLPPTAKRDRFGAACEQVEEWANPVPVLGGVPEHVVPVHGVHHAPPGAGSGEVPRGLQVGHDGLHGTL